MDPTKKTDNEKKNKQKKTKNYFLSLPQIFNETLMAKTHIGSDYFPLLLLSKFLCTKKWLLSKKKILKNTKKIGN